MTIVGHATRRWSIAFVLLALGGIAASVWAIVPPRPPEAAPAPAPASVAPVSATRLNLAPLAGARVTITAGPSGLAAVDADGAVLVRHAGTGDEAYDLRLDPTASAATVLLPPTNRWQLDLGGGFAMLRLALDTLDVASLQVRQGVTSVEGTLPVAGRSELALGGGRSALVVPRGAALDLRMRLGTGPLLLRIEPDVRGELDLVAGNGPATLVVDASLSVALTLPSGDPPPLALEGTWWRHGDDHGIVTWVRSPVPLEPFDAEVHVTLTSHAGAPLAITYR